MEDGQIAEAIQQRLAPMKKRLEAVNWELPRLKDEKLQLENTIRSLETVIALFRPVEQRDEDILA